MKKQRQTVRDIEQASSTVWTLSKIPTSKGSYQDRSTLGNAYARIQHREQNKMLKFHPMLDPDADRLCKR